MLGVAPYQRPEPSQTTDISRGSLSARQSVAKPLLPQILYTAFIIAAQALLPAMKFCTGRLIALSSKG